MKLLHWLKTLRNRGIRRGVRRGTSLTMRSSSWIVSTDGTLHLPALTEQLEDRTLLSEVPVLNYGSYQGVGNGAVIQRWTIDVAEITTSPTGGAGVSGAQPGDALPRPPSQSNGNALEFNLVAAGGMSQQAIDGFQAAADLWRAILRDDILVNINIDFTALGPGILGSTGSTSQGNSLSSFKTALTADSKSLSDQTAVANLPAGSTLSLYTSDATTGLPEIDNNGSGNNTTLDINTANAKALGLRPASDAASDGSISFSTLFTWDFDRSNGISGGAFDFVGVAAHEIGHLLGFVSGADTVDFYSGAGSGAPLELDTFRVVTPLDLFRYSAASESNGANIDLRADTATKYFSIDGGTTQLTTYSTGSENGDGRQCSHWKDNLNIGIMDPTAAPGEYTDITNLDVQAFDVIGWDVVMDLGDAPDTGAGTGSGNYQTNLSDSGPRHLLFSASGLIADPKGLPKVYLGAGVTGELSALQNSTATGDSDNGVSSFPTLPAGLTVNVSVTSTAAGAKLDYFFDFNNNGSFADSGEAFSATLSSGTQNVPVVIPANATLGSTMARFRLSTAGGLGPTGPAEDGEVEDYQVTISASADFGDAPSAAQSGFASSYPVTSAEDGARHTASGPRLGANRDTEADGTHSANADADDTTGSPDDEDGVTFAGGTITVSLASAATGSVDVNLQNADGASNRLDAWIDWNRDGDWSDAGEQIFNNFSLGTSNGVQTLNFVIPRDTGVNVQTGATYARFRLSTAGGLATTGLAANGEVEDLMVTIANASAAPTGVYINEIVENPAGIAVSDNPNEYVEIRGIASQSLAGMYLVFVESDSESNLGVIDSGVSKIINLNSVSIGTNGFLVIVDDAADPYSIASGTTIVNISGFDMEQSSWTALLVHIDQTGVAPVGAQDLDSGDNGLDALPTGWTIVDGIAVLDGAATDRAYSQIVFSSDADGLIESGALLINAGFASDTIHHAMRIGDSTGATAADWVAFRFKESPVPTPPNFSIQTSTNAAYTAGAVITNHLGKSNPTEAGTVDLSVTTQGSESGPTNIVYTVTLSKTNNTGSAITFDLDDLATGTATSGSDYTAIAANAQITVAAGASTGTLTVLVSDDTLLEAIETVIAGISNSSNPAYTIVTASATANITDNETATASLSVTTQGNESGPANIVYTVTLTKTNNTGSAITFDLDDLATGTATSGSDYTAISGSAVISVAAGASSGTLTVLVTDDALLEVTETVISQISNSSFAAVTVGTASAIANITDNDTATANLSVTTQGNESSPVNIVYTVTLTKTNDTGSAIAFDLDDLGTGTATSGSDYTAIAGSAVISVAAGASTGTLTVLVSDDALLEATETVIAQISTSSFAAVTVGTASATANITDNDTATASLSVTTQGNELGPANIVYTITLTKTNDTGSAIAFDLDDLGTGTATAGSDYTAIAGSAVISVAAGASTGTLTVLVSDDALLEATETVISQISNSSFAAVTVGTASATANITDNDTATASLSVTTQGNESGPVNIVYTITLTKTNNTGSAITFDLDDLGTGSATSGTDYTAISGSALISVAAGASSGTLTVLVTDDSLLEATETVIAQISNSSFAAVTINSASATASITDNDTATASLSVTTQGNETGPATIVYTVTLTKTNDTGSAITFDLDDLGTGTATSGSDYTAIATNAQITVAAGASTGMLTVLVTDDALLEATETVVAAISNSSNAAVTVGTASAIASITDNEMATANLSVTTQGNETGPVNIVYTITLTKTNDTGSAITFDLDDLITGTATSGSDYTAIAGSAVISVAAGASTGTLTVLVSDDALLEATETVIVQISNSSFAAVTVGTASAAANITDNDSATASLSVTTQGNESGPADIVYTVTLTKTNNTGSAITFDLDDLGTGTATTGSDYTAIAGNAVISVAAGASSGTLTVLVTDDALLEATETVISQISNSNFAAVTVGTASATANITDNDSATASLSVMSQGNESGPANIVYTVALTKTNNTGSAITFDLDDLGTGTATSSSDYTAIVGNAMISVAPGASTGTLTVLVSDDALLEATETVIAQISNSSFAAVTVGTAAATANIIDNETATASLSATTHGSETEPVNIVYTVTLTKTNNTGSAITFDLDDLGTGTATSGADYTAIADSAVITVATGSSTGTLTVLVSDDSLLEAPETVIAQISNSSFAAVTIGTASATANITDNDTATASLSVTTQGNETGPVNIVYTVTLSKTNDTGSAITFDLDDLATGTATSGADYTAIAANAVISVADGASTGTLTVLVTDDTLLEATETVVAAISNSSNAAVTIGTASATANITDNDTATASLSVTTQGNESGPANIVYTVTLTKTNNTGSAITFDLDDLGTGTATSGTDYTAISGSAVISVAAGASTGTLTVLVTDDTLLEATETVVASVSNSSNAAVTIGTAAATANITDNDTATASLSVTTQGNETGPANIVYTLTLTKTNNTGSAITFDLDDLGTGTATSGTDYTAIFGSAVISVAAGASSGTLTVFVTDDALLETTETVIAQISNSSFAAVTIGTASTTANITDNETATANLSVTTQGNETGPANIVYTVTLTKTNNTGSAITFDLDDLGTGTATSGSDYMAIAGSAVISVVAGASSGTLTVLVSDDALLEATETVTAQISNSSNAAVTVGTASATANITDNETATASLSETTPGSEFGPANIVYTVTLSKTNDTGSAITFDLDDLGTGTATSGADYTAISGSAVISVAAGASTGTLTVLVSDDALLEATETVIAQISNSSNAAVTVATASATANINDNDTSISANANGLTFQDISGNRADRLTVTYHAGTNSLIFNDPNNPLTTIVGIQVTPKTVSVPLSALPTPMLTFNMIGGDDKLDIRAVPVTLAILITGGDGNDTIYGNNSGDTINSGNGNDSINAGTGNDVIDTGIGNDTVFGGAGSDSITGGAGTDSLSGDAGNDTLIGGNDNDTLLGGDGNDTVSGDAGADSINGGNGNDTLDGGSENDTIKGSSGNDAILGGAGNDQLFGENDNDTIAGGIGNDSIRGGAGNDVLAGQAGVDTVLGESGSDTIAGGSGSGKDPGDVVTDLATDIRESLWLVFNNTTKLFDIMGV